MTKKRAGMSASTHWIFCTKYSFLVRKKLNLFNIGVRYLQGGWRWKRWSFCRSSGREKLGSRRFQRHRRVRLRLDRAQLWSPSKRMRAMGRRKIWFCKILLLKRLLSWLKIPTCIFFLLLNSSFFFPIWNFGSFELRNEHAALRLLSASSLSLRNSNWCLLNWALGH